MDWLLYNASWASFLLFPLISFVVNAYERHALARGADGLKNTVVVGGIRTFRGIAWSLGPASWFRALRGGIGSDIKSPATLVILTIAAANLGAGLYLQDEIGLWIGIAILVVYVGMLLRNVGRLVSSVDPPMFDADLVSLTEPKFFGAANADCRLPAGEVFSAGVAWRPTQALRDRGPVVLVFRGEVGKPTKAVFVGYRQT